MHGTMEIMDATGHTSVNWARDNADEVAAARATFTQMTGQGYQAFKLDGDRKGERITTFDPAAERMILVRQLVGG